MYKYLFLAIFVLWPISSMAESSLPQALQTNGCGPGGALGYLVPDSTLLTNCTFKNSCNAHDICYGKCLKGGKLFGKSTCDDETARKRRKLECDQTFFDDIVKENNGKFTCKFYGRIYRLAVTKLGGGFFNGQELDDFIEAQLKKGNEDADAVFKSLSLDNVKWNTIKTAGEVFQTDNPSIPGDNSKRLQQLQDSKQFGEQAQDMLQ